MFDKTRDMLQATVAKVPTRKGRVTEAGVHGGFTPRGDGRVTMIAASRKPQAASRKPAGCVLRPGRGRECTRRVTGSVPQASLPA